MAKPVEDEANNEKIKSNVIIIIFTAFILIHTHTHHLYYIPSIQLYNYTIKYIQPIYYREDLSII